MEGTSVVHLGFHLPILEAAVLKEKCDFPALDFPNVQAYSSSKCRFFLIQVYQSYLELYNFIRVLVLVAF